ncbi:UGSC family (seleno)protein [Alteraurantiacibacter buctensis]|uniref:UGSC-like domain-containing protein n=1 Tax=Alteraurantiacibacter buctensis TaxID=1503981 RepID=A0A844Z361_9SPHN|nr:hypothetical protein [Alteraurantiacibacter buctensis]MXO72967.1 hypothetical protein [Alteraurantiacibacter buctensis]
MRGRGRATRDLIAAAVHSRLSMMLAAAGLALAPMQGALAAGQDTAIAVLDPRGTLPPIELTPLANRLENLAGKRIAIIKSWPDNSGFDLALPRLVQHLEGQGARVQILDRNVTYSQDDPQLWATLQSGFDGYVYVAAASSSTTAYAFRWSATIERLGIPGVVVNFRELGSVGDLSNQRFGVAVRRAAFDYPPEQMEPAAFAQSLDAIVAGLVTPRTAAELRAGTGEAPPRPEVLLSADMAQVQERFHEMGLTDGLPIVPPTAELVAEMLTGTSHPPDEVVAPEFPPEGLIATVRDVAVNGVMAGCRPEHMPVLLASMEAFQKFNMNAILRSTNSFSFMQVVNGPIREQVGMNAGTNAVGPGNRANACMGRALRLFITNLGDGHFGTNLMAVIGSNSNYSFMFAENEERSPWPSLAEDAGFGPDESVLTLFTGGWAHAGNYGLGTGIADVPPDLARFQIVGGAALIVSPARAEALQAEGMSKSDLQAYLEQNACRPLGDLRLEGRFQDISAYAGQPEDTCVPRFAPGTIKVIVAGNDASPMMQAWSMYRPQSVSIDRWR